MRQWRQRLAQTEKTSWRRCPQRSHAPVAIDPNNQQKVDKDLAAKFAGKGKGDIDKAKAELIEEAKKRFAKDPKTLEKVQKYIEAHAKA